MGSLVERASTWIRKVKSARVNPESFQGSDGVDDVEVEVKGREQYERGQWGSKAEFLLSCIGSSVGVGNVWRFPYLAYQNGGGAFLLPYFILVIFIGKPLYYLETALGQFARKSPVHIWECAPVGKGIGMAQVTASLIVAIYYNVIMAYSVFYVGASFVGTYEELPWSYCGEWWGADSHCIVSSNASDSVKAELALDWCHPSSSTMDRTAANCTHLQSSTAQFWEKYVLNLTASLSEELGDLGGFSYPLPLCLLFSWIVVFFCVMKGVKSSGKVVYFTVTYPFVILLALLVKGCMLEGAADGLYYLFVPKWDKLLDVNVWFKAAEQMFYSLGICWGGLMVYGSYNKFHNRVDVDAAIVSMVDFGTSLIASCVIFSALGNLSHKLGVPIEDVAEGGQGLAFVVYPEALSQLPGSSAWSILFFSMLFFLGLDSEFATLETFTTTFYDSFPRMRKHKIWVNLGICGVLFLLGLPCVSFSGQYVLDLMDTYAAGVAIVFCATFEVIGLCWIYGTKNICRDIKLMVGHEPSWFWKICWAFISPASLIFISIASIFSWQEPKYAGIIPYPDWAHHLGRILMCVSAAQVPIFAAWALFKYARKGDARLAFKATSEWGPADSE